MDELVIDAVKLGLMLLVPRALGLPGGQTAGIVGVVLEGRELAQGIDAALKGDLRRRDEFAVLGGQLVFLGHLVQDLRREGFLGDLGVEEHQLTVFLAQLFAVGGRQQGGAPGILALLDLRGGSVPEIHLIIVEFIPGIDGVADAGQVGQRVHVLVQGLFVQKGGLGGGVVRRGGKALGHSSKLRLDLVQVRALIGHLRKFHERISPLCVL